MYGSIARSTTTEAVLEQFRIDIILGRYQDKEKVTETKLSDFYGASRSAIRNSITVLEAEGLITTLDNGTKIITTMTLEDINNLYDMREYVETTAVKAILAKRNLNQAVLFNALNSLLSCAASKDGNVLKSDSDFHATMVNLAGNKVLSQVYASFSGILRALFELNMEKSPDFREEFLCDLERRHSDLVKAIVFYDPDAVTICSKHVEEGRQTSLQVMQRIING